MVLNHNNNYRKNLIAIISIDSWKDIWVYSKHPGKEFGKFVLSSGNFFNDKDTDKGKM